MHSTYCAQILLLYYRPFTGTDADIKPSYYNTARVSGDGNKDGVYNAEDLSLAVNQGRTITAGLSIFF